MSEKAIGVLSAFSDTVLDIQRLAQSQAIEHFHEQMLGRLRSLISFDKAWWGRAALIDGIPEEHSSCLINLPASYLTDWQSIRHDDITIARVHGNPGHAAIIDMDSTPGLNWLGNTHDIAQLMCVIFIDPVTRLSEHLTLYRNTHGPAFSAQECDLLDCTMPHLAAAVSANQIRTLIARRESLSSHPTLALAVCDQRGTLHCAEPAFISLLLANWPNWAGPTLPLPIACGTFAFNQLLLEISAGGDLYILTARVQSALQALSPREQDVAQGFGEGKTYKEIARDLGVAPNTVRHHIRTIYSKLGVNDKAHIAQLLHSASH